VTHFKVNLFKYTSIYNNINIAGNEPLGRAEEPPRLSAIVGLN